MSSVELPERPNLEHLKKQARALLRARSSLDASAIERFSASGVTKVEPQLADALHVIAREYGFETWPALKLHVELSGAEPIEALVAAIKANDAEAVRRVLAEHPSLRSRINEPLPNLGFDEPALLSAVHRQNRAMIEVLLEAGANINERSRWWAGGFGVLDFASPDLSEFLLARGAMIDIHSAARLGYLNRVRDFLQADRELVHARGGDGQLPLHFASTVEIAALLLEHGAEIDARDVDHESTAAQYMACTQPDRQHIAKFLVERGARADILMASALGDLRLVESILNDDPETIRTSVSDRYFPRENPRSGGTIYFYGFGATKTAHMLAQQFGHLEVFELLMQRSPGWLRLLQSAEMGDAQRCEQLLEKFPTLISRLTPRIARSIVATAIRNNDRAVKLLVNAGWPTDAILDNHQTALHHAAWHGNLAMVNSLLEHHAPVDVFETEYGGSPLAWALHGSLHSWHRKTGDYPVVVRTLLAAGAAVPKPDKPLAAAEDVLEVLGPYLT